ncbi:acetolactate decarboxylase [Actinoplanes solisilvae]|uniref:acetolactate decarboxylase n=1 Tax=Actinoplanes solisilvae TaxID=2486853 RepID=UPI000FD96DBF|nr:acetolactate decarboxylase [Actinoplanes solisilvae]
MTGPNLLGDIRGHLRRELFQSSTVGALLAGLDDGDLTIGQLLENGDFGLGTFDALDGEMVVLDSVCYHLHSDGTVDVAGTDTTTPFAAVVDFVPDLTVALPSGRTTTRSELIELVESHVSGDNYFYAIRVDADVASITTRTVSRQEKPYPGLLEASHGEAVRTFENLRGTIAGFRSPDYAGTVTVPGFHLHFIDDERRRGGHVLEFELTGGQVGVCRISDLRLRLPESAAFGRAELTGDQAGSAISAAEGGVRPPVQ